MHKLLTIFSVAFAAGMVLTACAPVATPTAAPAAATSAPSVSATTAPAATAQPAAKAGPTMKNADTLVYACEGCDPQSLDPAWSYDTASAGIEQNVYEGLIFYNREQVSQYVPMLATAWKVSADGLTYTFNIRPSVKFQNGDTLKPSDVAYSWMRGLIESRVAGPQWIMLQPFFGPGVTSQFLDTTVKPGTSVANGGDDVVNTLYNGNFVAACQAAQKMIVADNNAMTVTVTLKQPWGPFLASIANAWGDAIDQSWAVGLGDWDGNCADAAKYNNPEVNKDPLFNKMNGTGPYSLTKWDSGNEIDLDANPNYWATQPLWTGGPSGPAKIAHIVIKEISEFGTRLAMLETGDADFIDVPHNYISQVDPLVKETCDPSGNGTCQPVNANGYVRLYKNMPGLEEDDLFFNQNVNNTGTNSYLGSGALDGNGIPPNFFADIHIRKAFVACFDFNTFIKQVWTGEALQPNGPIPPGELGYDSSAAPQQFSLATCKSEFALAAQDSGLSNLLTNGFYLSYMYNTGNTTRQIAGQILKQDLAEVNPKFQMSVNDEPWPVFLADYERGRLPAFWLGWLEDYHDPNDWVVPYLASGGAYSGVQAFDPTLQKQMNALVDQAVSASDQSQRATIYAQLNKIAVDNALDIFAVAPTIRHYEQEWIHGYYYNPIYTEFYFYPLSKGQ
ncbi:MAG: ABC transporter substrate-binding protein [Anaerolineales bacterium]|jgi:peptide/nickel transport system substrate-binding protein